MNPKHMIRWFPALLLSSLLPRGAGAQVLIFPIPDPLIQQILSKPAPMSHFDARDTPGLQLAVATAVAGKDTTVLTSTQKCGQCLCSAQNVGDQLLNSCASGNTALKDWRIRTVQLKGCHNAILLTSHITGKHYMIDMYLNAATDQVDDLIEMEDVVADQRWRPVAGQENKLLAVQIYCATLGFQLLDPNLINLYYEPFNGGYSPFWNRDFRKIDGTVKCPPTGTTMPVSLATANENVCALPNSDEKDQPVIAVGFVRSE